MLLALATVAGLVGMPVTDGATDLAFLALAASPLRVGLASYAKRVALSRAGLDRRGAG